MIETTSSERMTALKTAWVTGGSRGIGREIVKTLCKNGYVTAFCYLNHQAEALSLQQECGAIPFRCDVKSSMDVNRCVQSFLTSHHHSDVLVNNAGIAWQGLLTDMTDEDWQQVTDTSLGGTFRFCRAILPNMISNKSGRIINISSIWGQVGASCEAAYSAAKAGIIGLTKALAKEAGPSGITVNCIAPGVIETDMLHCYTQADLQAMREETPLGRLGQPADVAACIAYLVSPQADFITGQVIGVGGGFGL